jgi:hypothetical protein
MTDDSWFSADDTTQIIIALRRTDRPRVGLVVALGDGVAGCLQQFRGGRRAFGDVAG